MMHKKIGLRALEPASRIISDSDNYQILWIARGIDSLIIDFQKIHLQPYSIIFSTPGRHIELHFTCQPADGWILSFSRPYFLDLQLDYLNIKNADVFHTYDQVPQIVLSPKIGDRIRLIAEMISELNHSNIPNKEVAVSALLQTLLVSCN